MNLRQLVVCLLLIIPLLAGQALANSKNITDIQTTLSALGYDPGPIDGAWGRKTEQATRSFLSNRNIDIQNVRSNGRLDPAKLLRQLRKAQAEKKILAERQMMQAARGIALVIGNSAYTNVKALKNPGRDSALMAATLEAVGFHVTRITDANQGAIKQAVRDFSRRLRKTQKPGFFYFSGYALRDSGRNYLIPISARIQARQEIELEAVALDTVLRSMERGSSSVSIVTLDTFHANPYSGVFSGAEDGFASISGPPGTYVSLYTSPGQDGVAGGKEFSPYTWALANAILTPGLQLEDVFKHARQVEAHNFETGSITQDFLMTPSDTKIDMAEVIEASRSLQNPFTKFQNKTFFLTFLLPKGAQKFGKSHKKEIFYFGRSGKVFLSSTRENSFCREGKTGGIAEVGKWHHTKYKCTAYGRTSTISYRSRAWVRGDVATIVSDDPTFNVTYSFSFDGRECRALTYEVKTPGSNAALSSRPVSCEVKLGR